MSRTHEDSSFTHTELPHVEKRVLRIGVAGNYGLQTNDIFHAAERGVGYWLWSPHFKKVTPALKEFLHRERERHVVAAYTGTYGTVITAGQVRKGAEKALRILGVDQIDILMLGWLGRTSRFTQRIQDEAVRLKDEGKVKATGTSIHDRIRAGKLVLDSVLDAFMIRYNAKHPGAEQDIFPHLESRRPAVVAYTATSWRQLLKPLSGIEMPPWPGAAAGDGTPPPLSGPLCYRFCLTSPHVNVVLTGPRLRSQLDENLDALDAGPLSREEEAWVREYGRHVKARKRLPYV
ncbi:MAG: aldo/keto reductase [Gemmatimonadota bacterium]|nr:MAG: aldo/keto reductase [Gemmatimonadota bacterium]